MTALPQRDIFICHASEDKAEIARPLAEELIRRGRTVWFDEHELTLGDSLRQRVTDGLSHSRLGLVILSPAFFDKPWTEYELNGLHARQLAEPNKVIIPVWHKVTQAEVRAYSAPLADLLAAQSADGVAKVVDGVTRALDRMSAGGTPVSALADAVRTPDSPSPDADARPERPSTRASNRAASNTVRGSSGKLPSSAQKLVDALGDADEDIRYEAMSALHDRLTPDLLPTIEPLLDDHDKHIRRMAYEYYAELAGPTATPRLLAALDDTDEDIRYEAMSALHDRLTSDLLPTIEPLLDDHDKHIRRMAYEYYAELTRPG